jgi:hypothetical protein
MIMKQTICPNCGGSLESVTIGWRCKKCKGFISLQDGKFYEYVEKPFMPPQTNADRIRAMSDEELAEMLCNACAFMESCSGCPAEKNCPRCPGESVGAWEEWLKQPVGD